MDIEQLYREHSPALFRYLLRFTGDPEAAADAVQEAFLRLYERPPRNGRAKTWLFRVATNHVLERSRTQRHRLRLLKQSPQSVPMADAPADPAAELDQRELRREVRLALEKLSVRDRTALLLRAEGFAHSEIAEALRTGTHNIGSILKRALVKLASELRLDEEHSLP